MKSLVEAALEAGCGGRDHDLAPGHSGSKPTLHVAPQQAQCAWPGCTQVGSGTLCGQHLAIVKRGPNKSSATRKLRENDPKGFHTCSRCKELKPRKAFRLLDQKTKRLHTWCKPCAKEQRREHQAEQRARQLRIIENWRAKLKATGEIP